MVKTMAFRSTAATKPAITSRVVVVRASRQRTEVPLHQRIVPNLLASAVLLSSGLAAFDTTLVRPAHADEEEAPLQRAMTPSEKRRALMREAREKAQAAASGTVTPEKAPEEEAAAPSKTYDMKASLKQSLKNYDKEASKSPSKPAPPPENTSSFSSPFSFSAPKQEEAPAVEAPKAEAPKPFSFSAPKPAEEAPKPQAPKYEAPKFEAPKVEPPKPPKFEAPKPEPAPAPTPEPAFPSLFSTPVNPPAPKPATVVEPPKPAPVQAPKPIIKPVAKPVPAKPAPSKPGKRRGPLPLFLAQLLVLLGLGGLGVAATKYSEQTDAALAAVTKQVLELYKQVEKAVPLIQPKPATEPKQ